MRNNKKKPGTKEIKKRIIRYNKLRKKIIMADDTEKLSNPMVVLSTILGEDVISQLIKDTTI